MARAVTKRPKSMKPTNTHDAALTEIVALIEIARRRAARMVNATMTAVYWSIGRESCSKSSVGLDGPSTERS